MNNNRLFARIALISTLFFFLLQWFRPEIIQEQIETKTYDLRLRMRDAVKKTRVPPDILIVAIDDRSIKEVGRWPWGRDVMADLIGRISAGGPRVIGIDIMFTETESASADRRLGEAISSAGNVVLAAPFNLPVGKKRAWTVPEAPGYLWDSAFMEVRSQKGIDWKKVSIEADSAHPPIEEIARGAVLGHVNSHADLDGVTRWEILSLKYGDDCYPSFPLQVARLAMGIPQKDVIVYGGAGIQFGKTFIPTNLNARVLINYAGKEGTFRYVSASDILKGRADPVALKDGIVLVGTSALAAFDQKITPFSANTPGVEKNANVVGNILNNDFIKPSPNIVELAVILFTGLILGLLLPRLRAIPSALAAAVMISLYVAAAFYVLIFHNLWINLVYPVLNMVSIAAVQTVMRFFHEERQARELRRIFSSYVSPKIVRELLEHPEKAKLGGERKTVTILFSDVIGFTTLSEKREPEEVVALLNEYFEQMTEIIFKWDGTLDKFVGDEIMVIWGAPLDQPDHARLAVECALDMSLRLDEMRSDWAARGVEGLDCGIGINTGEVVIGNIGAQGRKMDYTAIGDHVNLAARVEKLTRQYGRRILITENTYEAIKASSGRDGAENSSFSAMGAVKVKGKEQEVRIFGCQRNRD